jgi:hypothetical protein
MTLSPPEYGQPGAAPHISALHGASGAVQKSASFALQIRYADF